ncbi:protein YgfX [Gilliamella apicola]|uniref:protein YgfX n=1 Tax=Gilliamella apicola TaxID=1196095 RepID=UPI0039862009
MWRTKLTISRQQIIILSIFYLIIVVECSLKFADTLLNNYTFIILLFLIIDWWRSICCCKKVKGEFALFHYINQIYWYKQRWYLRRNPLILRYIIILNLQSRRTNKQHTLFLMSDNFSPNDWRTLRYYLYQIRLTY